MTIHEIQLLTDDPEGTNYFYHELIGFKVLSSDEQATSYAAGSSILTFHRSYNDQPVYHFAFNIPPNRFTDAMDWISAKVSLIEVSPSNHIADFKSWNAKAFYFYDNNKNIVEMIARFDLGNNSSQPFDSASVCAISELGTVTDNPGKYTRNIRENYQLSYFSKQQPMSDFMALGDDNGLLIIVSPNRPWYPTTIRSARHWAIATIDHAGKRTAILL